MKYYIENYSVSADCNELRRDDHGLQTVDTKYCLNVWHIRYIIWTVRVSLNLRYVKLDVFLFTLGSNLWAMSWISMLPANGTP